MNCFLTFTSLITLKKHQKRIAFDAYDLMLLSLCIYFYLYTNNALPAPIYVWYTTLEQEAPTVL